MPAVPIMTGCLARAKLDSSSELLPGRLRIPFEVIEAKCERDVSFAESSVQFYGFRCGPLRLGVRHTGGYKPIFPISRQGIRVGEPCLSLGVIRFLFDGFVEIVDGLT